MTFDITRTLIKVIGRSPSEQYAKAACRYGLKVPAADLSRVYNTTWRKMRAEYPIYGIHQGLTSRQFWEIFVARVFTNAGHGRHPEILKQVSDRLWDEFSAGNNWRVMPHVKDCLKELKRQGLTLGVVSNFDERLEKTLRRQGLAQYFDFIVTSISAKAEKPNPQIYQNALRISGVPPSRALHVGNDIRNDYMAAREAGISAYLLNTEDMFQYTDYSLTLFNIKEHHILPDLTYLPMVVKNHHIMYNMNPRTHMDHVAVYDEALQDL